MFKSIFSRLFWTYALILTAVFGVVTMTVSVFVDHYNVTRQKNTIMAVSDTLEYWVGTLQIEQNNARATQAFQTTLNSWSEFVKSEITVSNLDGKILGSTVSEVKDIPKDYLEPVVDGNIIITKGKFADQFDKRQLTIGVPVKYNGNIVGAMFFNTPLSIITKASFDIVMIFVICASLSFLLAFVLLYLQSRRISKPINAINEAARNIAAGNFSDRVSVTSADEIGQLASSFNFMADSIEDLEDMRSEFISDVSHELRTPMTSISGFAKSIIDGKVPPDKEKEYLQIIVDESHRLSKLVNDMLEMSKMSSSEYQLTIEKFDVNELMRVCIISLADLIESRNLDLNVDFEADSLNVLADKDSIKRVILNLMDNAIKFSFENTTIGIRTWVQNKQAYISVGNFGVGIDKKDLSNVFNRFYKTDKSRQRNRTGAGLGLSLCKNILTLHHQSIWVTSNLVKEGSNTKYTTFTFTLETA
ncbi:MAG: HAMP domain-containing histidine kinase [Clostridia bacterium]|nr:HAMP domain-containing histidine kinase [Clostridia bacterium]